MRPSLRLIAVLALASMAVALPTAPAAAQAPAVCPATFQVLHDDQIGSLELPAGAYEVTVRRGLACSEASDLLREFLEDFDGRLPRPWRLDAENASFASGGNGLGFSVAPVPSPHGGGGGRHPAAGVRCPGTFRVLHSDRVGKLRLRAGLYRITLLSARNSCTDASKLFARFLQDFDGVLPRPWSLDVASGTFRRGAGANGFRVKPYSGAANPSGGGSGVHPRDADRCPGSFEVLNNAQIGRLKLPRGHYRITLRRPGALTCQGASSLFTEFLESFDGMLPRPWVLDVATATFTRGAGSGSGFRVKPVRG